MLGKAQSENNLDLPLEKGKRDVSTDDQTQWSEFKTGNKKAFGQLYKKYYKVLYNYSVRILGDPDLTRDIIHDLFLEFWKNRERLAEPHSVKSYLFVALRRKAIREVEKNKRFAFEEISSRYSFNVVPSAEATLISSQSFKEQRELLLGLMDQLTKRQKEAIYLRYFEDLSCQEISEVMELNRNSAYVLLSKALEALREKLLELLLIVTTIVQSSNIL